MGGMPLGAVLAVTLPEYRKLDWGEADDIGGQVHLFNDVGGRFKQHAHRYDHLSIVIGHVRLWLDGVMAGEYRGVKCLEIKAGAMHEFEILAAGTAICCVHNTSRGGGIDVIEEVR